MFINYTCLKHGNAEADTNEVRKHEKCWNCASHPMLLELLISEAIWDWTCKIRDIKNI